MNKQNIFKKIWKALGLFFSTLTGRESRLHLISIIDESIKLNEQIKELNNAFNKFIESSTKTNIKTLQTLYGIKTKSFFPLIINDKGKALNLSMHRDFKCELSYQDGGIKAELIIDKLNFETFHLDMALSYTGNIKKPLFDYACELFKERNREFMDSCSYTFILSLLNYSFQRELLTHKDIMEILGQVLLEQAKPLYISKNNLKDFDFEKGAIQKDKEIRND